MFTIVKAGWGDWAGPGETRMVSKKIQDKRDKLITKIQTESEAKRLDRKDSKRMNVMISERRVKTASKYKIADIPHPYTSWEEYDRSLQMPLGGRFPLLLLCVFVADDCVMCRGVECFERSEEFDSACGQDEGWSHHRACEAEQADEQTEVK